MSGDKSLEKNGALDAEENQSGDLGNVDKRDLKIFISWRERTNGEGSIEGRECINGEELREDGIKKTDEEVSRALKEELSFPERSAGVQTNIIFF